MIFELCPGGDLFDRVASKQFLKEKEVMRIVKKMCSALTYLHDRSGDCARL
jgi:serine/threonine protein kinase